MEKGLMKNEENAKKLVVSSGGNYFNRVARVLLVRIRRVQRVSER
jgi:hypothetical protein